MKADSECIIRCDCRCCVLGFEWWNLVGDDPADWFLTIYSAHAPETWRQRITSAWRVLRGLGAHSEAAVFDQEDIDTLLAWLNETVVLESIKQYPHGQNPLDDCNFEGEGYRDHQT